MRPFAALLAFCLLTLPAFCQTDPNAGWSGDLLNRLLTAPASEQSARSDSDGGGEGMVLRSYQLRVLHLGDPGRASHLVSILQRMLPADSRITEDKPANTLHVMTTEKAQQAALEFIAAMDVETPSSSQTQPASPVIPEDVKKALADLAAARPDSAQLVKAVNDATRESERRMQDVLAQSQDRASSQTRRLLFVGGAITIALIVVVVGLMLYLLRKAQKKDVDEAARKTSSALVPTKSMEMILLQSQRGNEEREARLQQVIESLTIAHQAANQRTQQTLEALTSGSVELREMLARMEQLSRDMKASGADQFLEANREAINSLVSQASDVINSRAAELGAVAETATKKIDETANRLEVQTEKTEKLAAELERTQKEVDALFNKLREVQKEADKARAEAEEQRALASKRAEELAKREAVLAGVSLLMQESPDEILSSLQPPEVPKLNGTEPGQQAETPAGSNGRLNGHDATAITDVRPTDASELPNPPCKTKKPTFRIMPVE